MVLSFKVVINKDNYEINIILDGKKLDKVKDIDIIITNYKEMKKELDTLKQKYGLNSYNNKPNGNIFNDSIILKKINNSINLISNGIKVQLNKNIKNSKLLYRVTRDGNDRKIFHQKCDGFSNTLVVGEAKNGRIFGGFTTQKWDSSSGAKIDNYAFLFQLNEMKIY